jgi:hypothetical protein
MAVQSRGSVNVFLHPPKLSLEAMATLFFSSRSVTDLEQQFDTPAIQLHVAQLIDAEEIDSSVAGDRLGQQPFVGGLDEFVHQLGGEGVVISLSWERRCHPRATTNDIPTPLQSRTTTHLPEPTVQQQLHTAASSTTRSSAPVLLQALASYLTPSQRTPAVVSRAAAGTHARWAQQRPPTHKMTRRLSVPRSVCVPPPISRPQGAP